MAKKEVANNGFDVRESRAESLGGFLRLAKHVMTDKSGLQSLFLSCSQYYCDEAADAVHRSIATSSKLIPSADDAGGDRLDWRVSRDHMSWDENGTSVYNFAPFCEEEVDEGGTSSPLMLAQRASDGTVHGTWLAAMHRPWLDFPGAMRDRDGGFDDEIELAKDPSPAKLEGAEKDLYAQVLASPSDHSAREVLRDVWTQREDPRGEFAALTSKQKGQKRTPAMLRRAAALVLEHGRSWLGPLGSVVPCSGALFDRGPFLQAATVYAADAKTFAKVANAPEWATVEELSFANQSYREVTSAMKNLRVVGPLGAKELKPLLAKNAAKTWRVIEELEYEGAIAQLEDLALPLKCLRIRTSKTDFKALAKAPFWSRLERLEIWLPADASEEGGVVEVEKAFKSAASFIAPSCRLAVGVLSNDRRSGWMLIGNAKERRLELALPDGRFGQGAAWAKLMGLKLTSWEPSSSESDWLHLGLGVSEESGVKAKSKKKSKNDD